jgi:hypothetical protein
VVWLDAEGDGRGLIASDDDQEDEQATSWRGDSSKRGGSGNSDRPIILECVREIIRLFVSVTAHKGMGRGFGAQIG